MFEDNERLQNLREWLNSGWGMWIAVGVVALCVVIAVASMFRGGGSDAGDLASSGRLVTVQCKACQHVDRVDVPYDEKFPVKCPKCRKREAVWTRRCPKCEKLFPHSTAKEYSCPHCGAEFRTDEADF
ncbi:hypothetical protein LCGC14_1600640 [marine sediment metagenome]|uniref:Uncharacterized protein n=1 Tax=marine sediment metagenome TaxID=412755 RepID=A0A0F9IBL4_9ZZZZ